MPYIGRSVSRFRQANVMSLTSTKPRSSTSGSSNSALRMMSEGGALALSMLLVENDLEIGAWAAAIASQALDTRRGVSMRPSRSSGSWCAHAEAMMVRTAASRCDVRIMR